MHRGLNPTLPGVKGHEASLTRPVTLGRGRVPCRDGPLGSQGHGPGQGYPKYYIIVYWSGQGDVYVKHLFVVADMCGRALGYCAIIVRDGNHDFEAVHGQGGCIRKLL
jgi:hypothetical protein